MSLNALVGFLIKKRILSKTPLSSGNGLTFQNEVWAEGWCWEPFLQWHPTLCLPIEHRADKVLAYMPGLFISPSSQLWQAYGNYVKNVNFEHEWEFYFQRCLQFFFLLGWNPHSYPNKLFGSVDKRINLRGFHKGMHSGNLPLAGAHFFQGVGREWWCWVGWRSEFAVFSFPFHMFTKHSRSQATVSSRWEGR